MADRLDIPSFASDELSPEALRGLIAGKKSFQISTVKDMSLVVAKVESEIEKQDLRCRVYTEYRTAAVAGIAVPTGITQVAGVATAIGIGIHNLVTFNPDYEIGKNPVASTITVQYKKDVAPD